MTKERKTREIIDPEASRAGRQVLAYREMAKSAKEGVDQAEVVFEEAIHKYLDDEQDVDTVLLDGVKVDIIRQTRRTVSAERLLELGVDIKTIQAATTEKTGSFYKFSERG